MKALIFNSGLGKRMEELTTNNPKSMVKLYNGETIFERQLRILKEVGIKDVVVTTGPFKEMLEKVALENYKDLNFSFINNPIYDKTNYIYSMYLAKEYLDDDMLILHGDLVFNKQLIEDLLKNNENDLITINYLLPLPEKDFKGRVIDGFVHEVSVNIFDDNCYALQPVYKLSKENLYKWISEVVKFVNKGETSVYADNALNQVLPTLKVKAFDYSNYYVNEIDTKEDLEKVSNEIKAYD